MTTLAELARSRIRRIDGPAPGLWAVTLRAPDGASAALLLSTAGAVDWGLVDVRPRGQPASSAVQLLRKHLENAIVEQLEVDDVGLALMARRGPSTTTLRLRRTGELELELDDRTHTVGRGRPGSGGPGELDGLRAQGPALLARVLGGGIEIRRAVLAKGTRRRIAKLARRQRKIAADRARGDEAERHRAHASAILAQLTRLADDATEVEVTDWTADPPETLRLPIGAGRTPREEAEALFRKARKVERGATIAIARGAATAQEVGALQELLDRMERAGADDLDALEDTATRLGVRLPTARAAGAPPERRAHHVFVGSGERPIHVGRSAKDNDALTLGAKPWDHWLHARGVPGSHVVVPLRRGEDCPADLLIDAAHLAAHYSQLRGEDRVEVTHVARRYVRKPRGYPPGAVRVEREKVIVLRLEADRLERLFASSTPG